MKKILLFGVLLLSLWACQRAELVEPLPAQDGVAPEQPTFHYSIPMGAVTDKSTMGPRYVVWETGDKPGFFAGTTLNQSGNITIGEPCTFSFETTAPLAAGSKIYGYYPYSSEAGTDPEAVTMSIPSFQVQPGTSYNASAMPQVFMPYTVTEATAAGKVDLDADLLRLCNLGALIRFEIFSTDAGEAGILIYRVSFQANESGLCGSFDFNLTGVDGEAILEDDYSSLALPAMSGTKVETGVCELPVGNSKNNAASVWMVVAPGTFSGTVRIMTNRGDYEYTLSSRTFQRNMVKVLGLDLHHAHRSYLRKVDIIAGDGRQNEATNVDGAGTKFRGANMQEGVPAPDGHSFWILQRGAVFAVRRFDALTGAVETIARHDTEGNEFMKFPWAGDFDSDGNFWFVNKGSTDTDPSVGKISESSGVYTVEHITSLDEKIQTLKNPMGLKFDADGNMFILCRISGTSKLLKYDSSLNLTATYDLPSNTGSLGILPDKSRLITGPDNGSPANLLLINPANGSYELIAGSYNMPGRANGQTHTALDGDYPYTDGVPGNPFSSRIRAVTAFAVDGNGWIWFTEGRQWEDKYHSVIRVLIPDATGDYTKGCVHTMAGIPYTMGYKYGHGTCPLVRSYSDLSTFSCPNGLWFYSGDLYVVEGTSGNRISRIFIEKHFDDQDGTELWSFDEPENL